jgi:hypothetical protein
VAQEILFIVAALMLAGWGIAHLVPTRNVVRGFGDITVDNRRIITMEWIVEGVALVSLGAVTAVLAVDPSEPLARAVGLTVFIALNLLSAVSLFTGAKIRFLPFRLCPVIFTGSSLLVLAGSLL